MEQQLPPAGWYPNPDNAKQFRYWDGTQWTEQTADQGSTKPQRHWIASRSRIAAILIAIAPIVAALVSGLLSGTSMFNEGTGSGAYLWLVIVSVPLGLIVFVVGAVAGSIASSRGK